MNDDTNMGGSIDRFPQTRISAIRAIQSANNTERERALDVLISVYWKPVYKYVRIKWNKPNEDAKDLTQGFFAAALEKNYFKGFDPSKAKFRTFLRACLDAYVMNEQKSDGRLKRGGDVQKLSLDFALADTELSEVPFLTIKSTDSVENYFDTEWIKSLFSLSIEQLKNDCRKNGKTIHFQVFELYDLGRNDADAKLSYGAMAEQFNIPVTDVTNYLSYARKEFKRIVLEKLHELTATEDEFRAEALQLLGVKAE